MKISIIVPFHFGKNWSPLLERCLKSIESQSFKDYEILLLKYGRAAETQNQLIERAKGDLIKILHADDYFSTPRALEMILASFDINTQWHISGCLHDDGNHVFYPHKAHYSSDIHTGNNTIGSPSVLTFRNGLGLTFDEDLDWLYDVSLYKKFYDKFGEPSILDSFPVTIGLHPEQLTHIIPDDLKNKEVEIMSKRYI